MRIGDGQIALAVERAIAGARRKLGRASCRELLSDFADGEGRSLAALLEGQEPGAYLDTLFFYDGSASPPCSTRAPGRS